MSQNTISSSEVELLRQDFKLLLNEVYELRNILEQQSETKAKYISVPSFAKHIGLSRQRVRTLCETGVLKAIQPSKDGGRWKILSTELRRLRQEAKANQYNNFIPRKKLAAA